MKFNPALYAEQWKKQHGKYERYSYNQFKPALDKQVSGVINHVKIYGGISVELSDMLITKVPMEVAYKAVYVNVGHINAGWVMKQINTISKKSSPSFFSEKWKRFLEQFFTNNSATRVSDVTETTREKVRNVLSDSQDLPISERATYIVDTLDDPDFNRNRALVIARTESTTAANYGATLSNEDADYLTNKTWIAVMDRNTRPDHADADGQVVGSDEMFIVGGYPARYPGDISLPANEVIQCRCAVAFIPLFAGGLPVLKD